MSELLRSPELDPPDSQRAYDIRVARIALIATAVVVSTGVGLALLWRLRVIVLLIVVSLFLAALLHPIVSFVERRSVRRGLATTIVFFVSVAIAAAIAYLLVHPVYTSATSFAKELPSLVRQAQHGKGQIGRLVKRLDLESYVKKNDTRLETLITGLGRPALAIGKTVVSGVVALVTIAVLTFFLLLEMPRMVRGVLGWMRPDRSVRAREVLDDVGQAVTGYMLGNLATSAVAGIVVFATLTLTNVPYAGVLAIWVGRGRLPAPRRRAARGRADRCGGALALVAGRPRDPRRLPRLPAGREPHLEPGRDEPDGAG